MAPGLTSVEIEDATVPSSKFQVSRAIFPDGIKTSGQHPPNYDEVKDYAEFPDKIEGPTLWTAEDYKDNRERWVHVFSEEETEEMSTAAEAFKASGTPLTGITKVGPWHCVEKAVKISWLVRLIFLFLASPAFSSPSVTSSSTGKASSSSKGFPFSSGATKNPPSRIWGLEPIWAISSVKMERVTCLDT